MADPVDGSVWGIVLGGGSGARFGGAKQFADLGGQTLIECSVAAALTSCHAVVCVVPSSAHAQAEQLWDGDPRVQVATGGASRAESVRAGLAAVPSSARVLVVADAAHPLASSALFARVVAAVHEGVDGSEPADGAVAGLPLSEVIAKVDADGLRVGGIAREGHVLVQMPQAFRADLLRAAHAGADDGVEDSAMVAVMTVDGRPARIRVVAGEPANLHVTTPEELELARRLVSPDPT